MMRTLCGILVLISTSILAPPADAAVARGLGLNLPLAARLTGAGNVRYTTSIDVSNHALMDTQVDFYFDGVNLRTQEPIVVTGMITNDGLGPRRTGVLRGPSSVHLEDFVAAMVAADLLPAEALDDGVLGSVLFVFNEFTKSGQGTVTARFRNELAGGTVGVSLAARVVTTAEPQRLIGAVRDSRGNLDGEAEVYPNLFINNIGLTPTGEPTNEPVAVEVSAVSSRTGEAVGVPLSLTIRAGQTASVNSVLQALQVPAEDRSVLVSARVTSGNAAIQGIVSQIDAVTRDGSVFEMSRADF